MKTEITKNLLIAAALYASLLEISPVASAAPEKCATYSVLLQSVQTPTTPPIMVRDASDTQRSSPYAWKYRNIPTPLMVEGSASAFVPATARFTDTAAFTPVAGQNPYHVLMVSENLLLTGKWSGDSSGRQRSAYGVYS